MPSPAPFEPAPDDIRALGQAVTDWIARHFSELRDLPVVPDTTPQATFDLFGEPMPEHGVAWQELMGRFERDIAPLSFNLPSPRYFGLM
ncbi:MAG: hypothetical protein Q7J79_12190, partial [Gemmatimonadales bacterium]|nr:hypothetical protein [Gemmatimonadales bacterium]